ncbi:MULTISPECIES: hypothetical protein [unclassified Rhodococcus (in: high G+C Gram-positive bacteria)]|uniref:hypothetical protein n=1 Tax=unclassified Rhodococcus (in: high G+C Gram-positive bacteria) TaxID=192944 RepID=UPI000B9BFDAE|nr:MULTISPECIES: hypothetical protein [unclassified Rhodococcus (in: high G+C Gram-positive bacteria)]OZE33004.1 hypothetical protein CH259_21480 [Rhodococcus sp. 05-2254-4]OZE44101.1 hypothetical protein CH261_17175 [Rhodococcus sp. 05-2254-3]OZE44736.1 hypothetical protein CH256_01605 [Rhodococcus sp. 05-2254-6]OZE56217.1 hypothetical protein CH283_01745 [Rhodococcus sp. 05-2254-2]
MSAFVRAARFVGDLDDEFYADELQRDIWNEASAVGFQSLLWIGLIAGAILPFAAGVTGAWVALGIYVALIVVAYVVIGYARARGIDMYTVQELRRARIAVASALFVLCGGGAAIRLLARYGDGNLGSLWIGVAVGAPLGFAAAVIGVKAHQRRRRDAELAAEKAELQGFEETD